MRDSGTSGDLLADRRFEYGRAALAQKDFAAAADLFEQVIDLVPDWPTAWFHLGEAQRQAGHHGKAKTAYRKALTLEPADRHGAALALALLGEGDAAAAMSPAYVARLFDDYAPRFEAHLTKSLAYRGPEILSDALRAGCAKAGRPFRFAHAIDLGCGTGLMGAALESVVARLTGVDLSQKMLMKAKATARYQRLACADMGAFLAAEPESSADLIIAADVFVYLGPLDGICGAAHRVLQKGGLLAFTAQATGEADFSLGEELRFSHADGYLRRVLKEAQLRLVTLEAVSTRQNRDQPVPGYAVIAERY
jgi:predicted TPR repeat methyltransferase